LQDIGWGSDHVGKLHRMQTAVSHLAQGRGKTSQRLEKATYALIGLRANEFPERIRNRAENVLSLRGEYVRHAGHVSCFHRVPLAVKKRFVEDLLALYEACLIDLGRTWPQWDLMYPKDREFPQRHSGVGA